MVKEAITKQYEKSLGILSEAVKKYDKTLWENESDYNQPAWQVVYHALYYANIYCAATREDAEKWPKQKKNYHLFMKTGKQKFDSFYTKEDMLEFLEFFRNNLETYLEKLRPEADCWPHWYDENQLEFHINNIRHIQHHTAEIIERHDIYKTFSYEWH